MRLKPLFIFFFIITCLFVQVCPASARSRRYKLHAGPGMKFKGVGWVRRGDKVKVLKEASGWVLLKLPSGKTGWIYQRIFHNQWEKKKAKNRKKHVKVSLKFQNTPEACIDFFKKALPELDKRMESVGDDTVEVVVSLIPRLRSFRLFLMIDFNSAFYRHAGKRFAKPGSIDLMPFNNCLWAMHAYKRKLIQSLQNTLPACSFVRRLIINIVLKKLNGDKVILQTKEDGVYIYFSPFLLFEKADGDCFKIKSEDPGKVSMFSAFQLPYPRTPDSRTAEAARGIARFFGIRS